MRLIANIISNNEIVYLKYLLPFLNKFCDGIVLVNNDDNQETKELAEKHNCKFLVYKIIDSTSDKRNIGLFSCADGDWILRIDTDEIPTFGFADTIRKALEESERLNVDRIQVSIYHLTDFFKCQSEMGVEIRLFKKNSTCRYEGKTHELIVCDKFEGNGGSLLEGSAFVHFNYLDYNKTQIIIKAINEGKKWYSREDFRRRLLLSHSELPLYITYPLGKDLMKYFNECKLIDRKLERDFINGSANE